MPAVLLPKFAAGIFIYYCMYILFIALLFTSCVSNKLIPTDTQLVSSMSDIEKDELITRDSENKRWARIYLSEIDSAINNDDINAITFYAREYIEIPKNIVPLWLRNHENYQPEISKLEQYFRIEHFLPAK
jgi:hypothetical protein